MKPPHNTYAERAVIRIALITGTREMVDQVALTPGDFWLEAHRIIWTAILAVYESGAAPTIATVRHRLDQTGNSGRLQPGYLAQLAAPNEELEGELRDLISAYADDLPTYIDTLTECAVARAAISGAEELRGELAEPLAADELAETIASGAERLERLASQLSGREGVPLADCLSAAWAGAEAAFNRGDGLAGIPSGIPDLNRLTLGYRAEDVTILAARPGMGKTAFALGEMVEAAKRGYHVDFISLEMSKAALGARILSSEGRVPGLGLQAGRLDQGAWSRAAKAMEACSKLPVRVLVANPLSPAMLMAYARRRRQRGRLDMIIIDYLQLMDPPQKVAKQTRDQQVAEISKGLLRAAKACQIPIIALSQLNRDVAKQRRAPVLSDLRESGSLEQDAAAVVFLHDDTDDDGNIIPGARLGILAKNRHGPTGDVPLRWYPEYTRYEPGRIG